MDLNSAGPVNPDKTMELLWARVRQRGDLPGFSKVVSAIIGAMRGDDDREFNMTCTVLQDPALTQKVLRLANSAMYSVFGQCISTVSKAVIVLGTEAIGHLALGLKLIDGLSGASNGSDEARAEMEKAVLAGHIARQVAASASTRDAEEAVVCSMMHMLGRMMTAFYLPEHWRRIRELTGNSGYDESRAASEVLGLGLDEIGRRAGRDWGLPANLVDTLRDVPPRAQCEPLEHGDWLAAISTLSTRCADALRAPGGPARGEIERLAGDYAEMLGLDAPQVVAGIEAAQRTAVEDDHTSLRAPLPETQAHGGRSGKPADAPARLERGVVDMRDALDGSTAGQILTMGLETVYQGLGFSRAAVFLRYPAQRKYVVLMSVGNDLQERAASLAFGDAYQPDVFHAALANDKMIFVEKPRDPAFLSRLPRWWRDAFPTARSFMVMPLTVNRQPAGFIYGDWDLSCPPARIDHADVAPLNALRGLVMRALETQRMVDASVLRRGQ